VDARLEGEAVVAHMQDAIEETRLVTASAAQKPLVYCEEWGKPLIHSQPWVAELIEAAGGRFLGEPGANTTPEAVAAAGPDVVIFAWCGAGNRVPLARVVAQRGWDNLAAARQGRVHCIPDELLNTPAPNLLDGLACLASICQPGLFAADARVVSLPRTTAALAAAR
jgi:iron complex transport system substrate-binding protein